MKVPSRDYSSTSKHQLLDSLLGVICSGLVLTEFWWIAITVISFVGGLKKDFGYSPQNKYKQVD
jgi:hypothetical protein